MKSEPNGEAKRCKLARGLAAVDSAMTLTTTDDITTGCQTRENSVIEPRWARGLPARRTAFAYASFAFTPQTIKSKVNFTKYQIKNSYDSDLKIRDASKWWWFVLFCLRTQKYDLALFVISHVVDQHILLYTLLFIPMSTIFSFLR